MQMYSEGQCCKTLGYELPVMLMLNSALRNMPTERQSTLQSIHNVRPCNVRKGTGSKCLHDLA